MSDIIPSAKSVTPAKSAKPAKKKAKGSSKKKGRASTSSIWSWIGMAKGRAASKGQLTDAAKSVGTILGAGTAWSIASGYQDAKSKDLKVGYQNYKIDARLLVGGAGIVSGYWSGKPTWYQKRFAEIGVGSLASWLFDQAHDRSVKMYAPAAPAAQGIVVGRVGKRIERIEKKEAKLETRLDKLRAKVSAKQGGGRARDGHRRGGQGEMRLIDNVPLRAIRPEYRKEFASA